MASNNSNTLVDEKLAISLFLDSLLYEPEVETKLNNPEMVPAEPISDVKTQVVETVVEANPEVKIQKAVTDKSREESAVETKVTSQSIDEEVALASNVPEWANQPFQILLFDVAGLKLAVPLMELSGVIEWTDSVTEMPGHADFYMGILQHLGNKIAVIDTARMVLPKNKVEEFASDNPRDRVKHIVLIDDYRWGLACDKIGDVITLDPDEVRWRTSKTSRSWLAGTVIEHMCALLNSEGFAAMLKNGIKS
ncbi:MAG: chemotaxis protein CheW [Gammaproteobacteria bacterium]|nr:chemotaxis protein CheW [Gammaproteobacteria bacterium]